MSRAEPNSRKDREGRSEIPLSEGLRTRLASYAAAASAAGVGLLATAVPANARIVYTPAYTVYLELSLDLNHNGITDFTLSGSSTNAGVRPAQAGNAILGMVQPECCFTPPSIFYCFAASALPAGHRIGAGSRFGQYGVLFFAFAPCGNWGYFSGQGHYLGLEFTVQGQKYFGWARLNPPSQSTDYQYVLTGYAYETVPGKAIRAGDTGLAGDASVPGMHRATSATAAMQPATLGMLALGSSGLDIWRREDDM